jgi:1-acyl-sn-glycerol-3-phosphate acyltransferase
MNFEDIRPYKDEEYLSAIKELCEVEPLMNTLKSYLPELSIDEIKKTLLSFTKIQDFQSEMVCKVIDRILVDSVNQFTYDGILRLDKNTNYLLVSNHRDIVLDSALINYCLNKREYNTSEIAIGSNLLSQPWIKQLVRVNKSFIVKRNLPLDQMLEGSRTLSAYISYTLKEKKQSVWIAQREGRAKDGFDKTNPGLLKMFGMAAEDGLLDHLQSLNITPVSLSYEFDPCDNLKIPELLKKAEGLTYTKAEGEDNMHMVLGIKGYKGNIHIQFGSPINDEIEQFRAIKNKNELLKNVAEVIDKHVYQNYKLWDSNYVAYDLLNNNNTYTDKYSNENKEKFVAYMNKRLENFIGNEKAKEIFLKMYANPVINAQSK